MAKVSKGMSKGAKTGVAVGLGVAAAVASAGYYFFGSKSADKNRKVAVKWAHNLKADVVKGARKLKKLDQKAYATIVDQATKAYSSVKSIHPADLKNAAMEPTRSVMS